MPSTQVRILCVDSSDTRRIRLHAVLEEAGFDVWMSRDAGDALSLATRLPLDAVIADQPSTLGHEENWEKLMATRSALPVLVHSAVPCIGDWSANAGEFAAVRSENPEVIMAILTLLLGPAARHNPEVPTHHAA
jgi:DNA-binding NtrC family response regulator